MSRQKVMASGNSVCVSFHCRYNRGRTPRGLVRHCQHTVSTIIIWLHDWISTLFNFSQGVEEHHITVHLCQKGYKITLISDALLPRDCFNGKCIFLVWRICVRAIETLFLYTNGLKVIGLLTIMIRFTESRAIFSLTLSWDPPKYLHLALF